MTKSSRDMKNYEVATLVDPAVAIEGRPISERKIEDFKKCGSGTWMQTCIVPHGRGKSGKSTLSRLLVECAVIAERPLRFSDADRANAGLQDTQSEANRPESADLQDIRAQTREEIEKFIEGSASSLIDFGAGNPVFEEILNEVDLAGLIRQEGKRLLVFCLLGPVRGDLSYIDGFLQHPSLAEASFVICCNEGLAERHREITAFDPYIGSPQIRAALDRGARLVRLPRLIPAEQVETLGLTYLDAALGRPNKNGQRLKRLEAATVAGWLRRLPEAFEPIADWMSFAPVESLVTRFETQRVANAGLRADWRVAP